MKKTVGENTRANELKRELGYAIKQTRTLNGEGGISQRKLAEAIGIPPSNMKYIEDGVNAPSPRVYDEIVRFLGPDKAQRETLDRLYSLVRETPPPDVCRIICANEGMNEALRAIKNEKLNRRQMDALKTLLTSFNEETAESTPANA